MLTSDNILRSTCLSAAFKTAQKHSSAAK